MYPLVLLIAVGIYRRDKDLPYYVLPLSFTGMGIAFYHVLLQKGILPEAVAPCALGASCTTKFVGYFGFITIPVMSLTAFTVITLLMFLYLRRKNES
jgi:disulfide bond formation protein DsbB